MKLLKSQYQDIVGLANSFHISEKDISLIKRRGRINISIPDFTTSFEFFRRKSISLSADDHQWEKLEHYELNFSGQKIIVASWDEVVHHFERWLQSNSSS
ncbi:MAG: hypothetical protein AB7O48_12370 [Cyclobacteriaceae bacterium]